MKTFSKTPAGQLLDRALEYARAYATRFDEPEDGDCWKTVRECEAALKRKVPGRDDLAALLREAHDHMADSLPYFPDDEEREGEEGLSRRIDAALRHYSPES